MADKKKDEQLSLGIGTFKLDPLWQEHGPHTEEWYHWNRPYKPNGGRSASIFRWNEKQAAKRKAKEGR